MPTENAIHEFWGWFAENADQFAKSYDDELVVGELDERVCRLDTHLSWELGPGVIRPHQLVLSPDLDRAYRDRALDCRQSA